MTDGAELFTVSDSHAVAFQGARVLELDGLQPGTEHALGGERFRTLVPPSGELLARVATVNDVHFGETVCGLDSSRPEAGPVFRAEPGGRPYPEVMNEAAVAEIAAIAPDAVVAKGDLTDDGSEEEYDAFLACYGGAFGDRLHHVRGNHDSYRGQDFAAWTWEVTLPGATLAMLDTTVARSATGRVPAEQLEWLDELAARADRPVLLFGHHHPWQPGSRTRPDTYYGLHPDDSERLVEVAARRPAIIGYFCGHTHRNRVRRFAATGEMPWVEVACVKDYPGAWAEYRVHEGGVMQLVHRIRHPDALEWTERTRHMFDGTYADYARGTLADRCFVFGPR